MAVIADSDTIADRRREWLRRARLYLVCETRPGGREPEELLRFLAVTDFAAVRWVTEDIEIAGHTIRAKDGIVVSSTMVNRDPGVHENPHSFEIARGNRQHLTFGYGIHQCLGQNLARLEAVVFLEKLLERLPEWELAAEVDYGINFFLRGPQSVWVRHAG